MKAKVYIGAKKYAVYIGRKIVEKTLNFFSFPARFFATKDGALKNYKVYGNTVQGGLPEGYTRLEYIESTTTQYINTGIKGELESELTFIGKRTLGNPNQNYGHLWGDLGVSDRAISFNTPKSNSGSGSSRFGNKVISSDTSTIKYIPLNTPVTVIQNKEKATASTGFEIAFDTTTEFETDNPLFLFTAALSSGAATTSSHKWKCEYFSHKKNGVLVQELIPCKNAQGEIGMYDTVSGNFFASNSATPFVAGPVVQPTPTEPVAIESVGDKTKNLFNKDITTLRNAFYSSTGGLTDYSSSKRGYFLTGFLKTKPNTEYIINCDNEKTYSVSIVAFDKNKKFIERLHTSSPKDKILTVNETTEYVRLQVAVINYTTSGTFTQEKIDETNLQIEEGSVATPYEPYGYKIPVNVNGTNTNIYLSEPLRKLGDLTDYIDYENQKVVRQVGIVNGSDFTWTKGSYSGTGYYTKFDNYTPIPADLDTAVQVMTEITTTRSRNEAYNNGSWIEYSAFMSATGNLILITKETDTPKCDIYYTRITPTEESITLSAIALQQGNITMDIETKIKPSQLTITGDIDDVR